MKIGGVGTDRQANVAGQAIKKFQMRIGFLWWFGVVGKVVDRILRQRAKIIFGVDHAGAGLGIR